MIYPPIPSGCKGKLRWNLKASRWDWVEAGPYFRVTTMWNGNWRVNRVRL